LLRTYFSRLEKRGGDSDVVQGIDLVFQFSRDKLFTPGVFSLDFPNALSEFNTGKCAFYLFHDSVARQIMEANPANMELDVMLMPNLVGKPVESQFPGGPGLVLSIPTKIDPKRKDVAIKLIDFLTTDSSNAESVKLNGGAVPVLRPVRIHSSAGPFGELVGPGGCRRFQPAQIYRAAKLPGSSGRS
jgi:ABC-type glycerol-3-phosphate transport system substrate-binding protein